VDLDEGPKTGDMALVVGIIPAMEERLQCLITFVILLIDPKVTILSSLCSTALTLTWLTNLNSVGCLWNIS
jgi:hypothetical protein